MTPLFPKPLHCGISIAVDNPRIVFITGANRGLGLALAEEALGRGDLVIGTYRAENRAQPLFDLARRHPRQLHVLPLDVADEASCAQLEARTRVFVDHLDVLINNAGINSTSHDIDDGRTTYELSRLTTAALDRMMHTNAFGSLFVTRSLISLLSASRVPSRVINVSSRRGALEEKTTGGNYGYCMSKAALNMATRALAADLESRGMIVVAVHPGAVRTSMAQPDAMLSPAEAALRLLDLTDRLTTADNGLFLESNGASRPW